MSSGKWPRGRWVGGGAHAGSFKVRGGGGRNAGLQHALNVARHGVHFQVDTVACQQVAQRGVVHRVRDEVDAELAPGRAVSHAVDRQAHAIDGDGPLVGQETAQLGGGQHTQLPAFAHAAKVADGAHTVHMARHDVPAQAVGRAQRFFQVDPAAFLGQPAGTRQRLGRYGNVKLIGCGINRVTVMQAPFRAMLSPSPTSAR